MDRVKRRSEEIIKSFSGLSSWEDRYKKIIQLGKIAPPLEDKYKTEKWLVKGCQSQVWLHAYRDREGKVVFRADSDALITKGLVSLLLNYYSALSPGEILSHPVPSFFKELDLKNHLTPTRVGGLFSMIRQIQYYARVFSLLSETH
jgi:cysteine desulfuration protein SufE